MSVAATQSRGIEIISVLLCLNRFYYRANFKLINTRFTVFVRGGWGEGIDVKFSTFAGEGVTKIEQVQTRREMVHILIILSGYSRKKLLLIVVVNL